MPKTRITFLALSCLIAPLAHAQGEAPAPAGPQWTSLIIPLLFIGAMYFLLIAPQRKRQKEHEAMVKAVKAGDKIVSAGGIYGQITKVKDDRVTLRISENVTIDLAKSSIGSKVTSENAESGETN